MSIPSSSPRRFLVFHPLLVAIYPVAALYLQNFNNLTFAATLGSFALALFVAALFWRLAAYWMKDPLKSGLVVSVFFLLFFSFGHFMAAIANILTLGFGVDPFVNVLLQTRLAQGILLVVWLLLFLLIVILTQKARSNFRLVTQFMNAVSIALTLIAVVRAVSSIVANRQLKSDFQTAQAFQFDLPQLAENAASPSTRPDIYYIILDGYARSDVMQNIYRYDNTPFLDFLRQNGFYVADAAHSNYGMTYQSLPSSLNFEYINFLTDEMGRQTDNPLPLLAMLEDNRLSRFLHTQGYQTVLFSSGFPATDLIQADQRIELPVSINAFQNELINKTPLRLALMDTQYNIHRGRILYQFAHLTEAANASQPRLIFAHILAPHPPFVFKEDGSPLPADREFVLEDGSHFTDWLGREVYQQDYRQQAIFITQETQALVEQLLALDPQPIIILQSDHGPGSMMDWNSAANTNMPERLSILNAYYFPTQDYTRLYPAITPVNTFRVILDQYFGAALGLLPDYSYWAPIDRLYDWSDVTETLKAP